MRSYATDFFGVADVAFHPLRKRPGADECHLAADDVDNLRQLIQPGVTQGFAQACKPRVIPAYAGIRYMGINAPELYERWGTVAYETNRDLVEGKLVRIELDHPDRDFYGRTLAHVWIDDVFVSERLVDDGLAKVFLIKGEAKPTYLSRLEAAEERAKGASRGLWTPQP